MPRSTLDRHQVGTAVLPTQRRTHLSSRSVVSALGELRRALHEVEHDGTERLEIVVVAGAVDPLPANDVELPLGENHVVVDVIDLPTRYLGVALEDLLTRWHT